MHARGGGRDVGHVVDTLGGFQDGVDQDRALDAVLRLELGEELVEIVDVPDALDLGQHDHVELVADRRDDLDDVVERPWRVERIDPRPQPGGAEIIGLGHLDEAAPRRLLGVGGNGVLEVAEHDVHLADQVRHLLAYLGDVGRHEMDHALEPHRQFAQRRRRADRQRLEELTRQLHRDSRSLWRSCRFRGRPEPHWGTPRTLNEGRIGAKRQKASGKLRSWRHAGQAIEQSAEL